MAGRLVLGKRPSEKKPFRGREKRHWKRGEGKDGVYFKSLRMGSRGSRWGDDGGWTGLKMDGPREKPVKLGRGTNLVRKETC